MFDLPLKASLPDWYGRARTAQESGIQGPAVEYDKVQLSYLGPS